MVCLTCPNIGIRQVYQPPDIQCWVSYQSLKNNFDSWKDLWRQIRQTIFFPTNNKQVREKFHKKFLISKKSCMCKWRKIVVVVCWCYCSKLCWVYGFSFSICRLLNSLMFSSLVNKCRKEKQTFQFFALRVFWTDLCRLLLFCFPVGERSKAQGRK